MIEDGVQLALGYVEFSVSGLLYSAQLCAYGRVQDTPCGL